MPHRYILPAPEYRLLEIRVRRRDQHRCRVCNKIRALHVHHIIFRSSGGHDVSENLISLCERCHNAIHVLKTLILLPLIAGQPINADAPIRWRWITKEKA
jgi:hypothetical protein